jgi:hypothetical protein
MKRREGGVRSSQEGREGMMLISKGKDSPLELEGGEASSQGDEPATPDVKFFSNEFLGR